MRIMPAIDLYNYQCVRLYQGDYHQATVYGEDPSEVISQYIGQGASALHLVDLNGARDGQPYHTALLHELAQQAPCLLQAGGGLRSETSVNEMLNAGVDRVVIGSLACNYPQLIQQWLERLGPDRVVLALDVMMIAGVPRVLAQGWQYNTGLVLWDLLEHYQDYDGLSVLCTDIERDGTLHGPNTGLYDHCVQRFPQLAFQASGGIQSLEDLQALKEVGVDAVIIGKALLDGQFTLKQALSFEMSN
jgi:phosphoribosylformimino-5-aminoimidazole carboxamide ribotide isomerase